MRAEKAPSTGSVFYDLTYDLRYNSSSIVLVAVFGDYLKQHEGCVSPAASCDFCLHLSWGVFCPSWSFSLGTTTTSTAVVLLCIDVVRTYIAVYEAIPI